MSETLSQDPELNTGYTNLAPSYPPTPATPSSTVQDGPPGTHLPPFSTFATDMDSAVAFNTASDRLFSDTRLLDISNWDYYTEARILDRSENGLSIISSQPQYRPWESKSADSSSGFTNTTSVNTFADAFVHQQNGVSKLPSFQSQFQSFNETVTTTEPTLTTLTNLTPVSPNSSPGSHSLTTLNSNFHTLSAVNPRGYPLVPAPIQAREIPSIQQQFLDERHIQLYTHPNINNTIHPSGIFPTQNGTIIQNTPIISSPTVVTVLKSEPDLKLTMIHQEGLKTQGLHPTQFQNPMLAEAMYNGMEKKNGSMGSPTRNDFRKKERRKMRASSLESSAESDGASSNMEMGSENSGQVAAVSSTAGFKSHHQMTNSNVDLDDISGGNVDKQVKKKRKRCGECIGCQRKDNCGDCAPCRNDKSHQICKQRRCEKLTEKKNLYGDANFLRGESRRGRGKGRGAGSYRGRKPSGPMTPVVSAPAVQSGDSNNSNVTIIASQSTTTRPSPQPSTAPPATTVHMLKTADHQSISVQQQSPMVCNTPMPFYAADPNRFATPVWQTEAPQAVDVLPWAQGQFIQQIPATQATIEGYQQYPNGIYQATYQQPTFETNTFYTGAVQVLTNARPPSASNQSQLTPRPNSNYAPSPAPGTANRQYQEYTQNQNFVSPATTPSANQENASRPSSVNSNISNSANQQNFNQSGGGFTAVSSAAFSPNSNNQNYTNSGNAQPGYPQVNSSPQLVSHNSSGYPGNDQFGGTIWHGDHHQQVFQEQNTQYSIKTEPEPSDTGEFSQSDRVNLNTRLKTMILSKQQEQHQQQEDTKSEPQQTTGHFLSYSHHHRYDRFNDGGGARKTSHARPKQPPDWEQIPSCECFVKEHLNKPIEPGVFYTHLGYGVNVHNLRSKMEKLTGVTGHAIRIETVRYTGKEGKTVEGCPIAKWIIRRSNIQEKYLIIVKHRLGHFCQTAFIVIAIVIWEGLTQSKADNLYRILTEKLKFAKPTNRRCAANKDKTCGCQGMNPDTCGASFSFGCSWSNIYNGCKFARSTANVEKFKMEKHQQEAQIVEHELEQLATEISPIYKNIVPASFHNQCVFEDVAGDCRIGYGQGRPFAGVTACVDFCAHSHKDTNNMIGGCTAVVTLSKNKPFQKNREDEQLHVLPMYVLDEVQKDVQVLSKYETQVRSTPSPQFKRPKKSNQIQYDQISSTVPDHTYANKLPFERPHLSLVKKRQFYETAIPPNYSKGFSNFSSYQISNPFDDSMNNQETFIDNSECFRDAEIGGVAIALENGSVLFEYAKAELHATTAVKQPNRNNPTRISLVYYQHRKLNTTKHGQYDYALKGKLRQIDLPVQVFVKKAPTLTTITWSTVFPVYPCQVTGKYPGTYFWHD